MKVNLIAFTGFGGVGKDETAKPLVTCGYVRCCFGDIIKGQVDELVQRHFGFSAYTEDREQKAKIRRTLESWGEDNYDAIFAEFFDSLPERAVNTRLCRLREAQEWVKRGGVIVEVWRPGIGPETEWARRQLADLKRNDLISTTLVNDEGIPQLHERVKKLFNLT